MNGPSPLGLVLRGGSRTVLLDMVEEAARRLERDGIVAGWTTESGEGIRGRPGPPELDLGISLEVETATAVPVLFRIGDDGGGAGERRREVASARELAVALREELSRRWRDRPVRGAILVGGRSRRMGRPKAELLFRGRRFLDIVRDALTSEVAGAPVLVGDAPPGLAEETVPDVVGSPGPLGGLRAVFGTDPGACWIVAAVDLPLIEAEGVRWLVGERAPGRWVVMPRLPEVGPQPLLAVYEPEASRLLEDLAATGGRAPTSLAGHPKVASPEPPETLRPSWRNVNTPEELAALS